MPPDSAASAPRDPSNRRGLRTLVGVGLALGLPLTWCGLQLPAHTADPMERKAGWLERASSVVTVGRLTARDYHRRGLGEQGADTFTLLEVNGAPVEIAGGHLAAVGLCEACDASVGEAAVVWVLHRDEAKAGLFAVQLVDGALRWTRLCDGAHGQRFWEGMTYTEPECGVTYDARIKGIVAEESEPDDEPGAHAQPPPEQP